MSDLTTEEKATLYDWMDSKGLLNHTLRAIEYTTRRQKNKVKSTETKWAIEWESEYWCDCSETARIDIVTPDDTTFQLLRKAGFK